jgi:hypothetical protein
MDFATPVTIKPAKVKSLVAESPPLIEPPWPLIRVPLAPRSTPSVLPLILPKFVTLPPFWRETAVPNELLSVPFASTVRVRATSRLPFAPIATAPPRPVRDPIVRSPAWAVADPSTVAICAVHPFATSAAKSNVGVVTVQLSGLNQSPAVSKRQAVTGSAPKSVAPSKIPKAMTHLFTRGKKRAEPDL